MQAIQSQIQYCIDDLYRNLYLKKDLIYLIRKYLRNKDGNIPSIKKLSSLNRKQLYMIWCRHTSAQG